MNCVFSNIFLIVLFSLWNDFVVTSDWSLVKREVGEDSEIDFSDFSCIMCKLVMNLTETTEKRLNVSVRGHVVMTVNETV